MTTEAIPFLDLVGPHVELEKELVDVFTRAMRAGHFVGGPDVENFENEFAQFCGSQYAVGVNSGTDALRFILFAAGVKPGDIVITVPNTFIATTESISQAGAFPMFVDVDEETFNMSAEKLEAFFEKNCLTDPVTKKTVFKKTGKTVSAIVPVHLYGQMADMDALLSIAARRGCVVIEDACQAHGSSYFSKKTNTWRAAGTMGLAGAFSFYPGKNLGALGEGGMVTTSDAAIASTIRVLRDHGQRTKYYHDIEGYNGRLDAIQAGFLSVKLRHLGEWNKRRRERAHYYNYVFEEFDGVATPLEPEWTKPVYHLYVVRVAHRDDLRKHLEAQGIGSGIHYPVPLHLQKAYAGLGLKEGNFPVCETLAKEIVSLPMFPNLTEEQQNRVVESIADFLELRKNGTRAHEPSVASAQ
jgi:dTDP-4-amino-4,6-dideoxygalactose transaminase